jgi:hypothetical protein
MSTEWERVPLCPVTVKGGLPIGQSPKTIFRVEVADPPEDMVTLLGLKVVVTWETVDAERLTVPEKPPVLVTLIVTKCLEPAMIWLPRSEGFAVMVKSPVALAGKSDGKATASPRMTRVMRHLAIPIFMFYLHFGCIIASCSYINTINQG